ncbi:MAG: transcriptional regulator [Deltaproteobacteria bacterium]|nr:transcriptional regulator [Deltaproteobacteria bacterium]
MVFIESPIFSRRVAELLDDDELGALEWALTLHPEAGVVIPGTGGVRKLRWGAEGRGKRGGLRVVYYWRDQQGEIWLLTVYDKHEQENIPAHVLRALREELMP